MSKQHRPQLDWTPDAKLPTRFKAWKAEIEDEILLFEGERGKAILAELNVYQEDKDYERLNTQQDDSREAMLSAKHTSQEYYNSHAKEREQLSELQHVWYKKDPVAHWQRGSVVQIADTPKSYVVQDDSGARYQRNSRHVRPATVPTDSEDPSDATPLVEPDRSKDVPRTFTETGDVITRSGRVSRKTVKYTA
ncbi:hypothetical protein CAPTEDRAFT_215573 [Capitella teleta]|uniref:Uncharacterized protein n=1 Tax=Capitella teleta TaxID=283909 RepID=R7U8V3_CAPTE|nr:hypothetical protein CAPTEDRAFT_215573 [Capitella teleta]|eukprot:ELU02790.1 hypothetical protein CAPTEDRAFT_215573 [Capitella teleta]